MSASSSHKFLSTIMASGTLEDKISALTLLVQESPLHTIKAFENLLGLAKKKSRNQALMAVAALKDLLGQGSVLPSDRKLRPFAKQPGLLGALQKHSSAWREGDALPGGLTKLHLVIWAFEDWLKKQYFELLKIFEAWCSDEVAYARGRAITYVWEMLKDKPEQEENLLRLLVNKLGDTDRKIASRTSYLLLQLQITHPAMKATIINSIESECLFRPGQSSHAKYYAVITLNQTILSTKEDEVANKLLEIYFGLFIQFLKAKPESGFVPKSDSVNATAVVQRGGGKPGKMAAKKAKAQEKASVADDELREKMVAQVLSGVNRAFPFAKTDDPTFEQQMNTIFRVTHSSNFNTSIQALMLIQQISSTKHYSADRFYRTLYESLLDPRLLTSSKQIMYLNLLYRSLKSDINVKRVQAFVKRLLQIITMHEPPFVCGVLYLLSELEVTFPSIRNMIKEQEVDEEDEEEHFVDAPEEQDEQEKPINGDEPNAKKPPTTTYDPRKRDPEHSNADRSALWDLVPILTHFHPSVSLFTDALLHSRTMPPKPDPSLHTLMHFLDRFVYRNAKSTKSSSSGGSVGGARGSSIMQPMSGSTGADVLVKNRDDGRHRAPLNNEAFWRKDVADVAPDEVFFHSYFARANKAAAGGKAASAAQKKREKQKARRHGSEDGSADEDDEEEEEIWKALVDSKPDIEGSDDDDDLSMGDLDEAYGDGSELGGDSDEEVSNHGDVDGGVEIADFPDEEEDEDEEPVRQRDADDDLDGMPDLESGDEDAMLGDDDEIPFGFADMDGFGLDEDKEDDAEDKAGAKKSAAKKKRKLKHLPTFASADDYAKMLDAEEDEVY